MVLCGLGDSLYIKNDWWGPNGFGHVGGLIFMMGGTLTFFGELGG